MAVSSPPCYTCRHTLISGKTLLESTDLERLNYGISQAGRGAQAWRSRATIKVRLASYLGIQPLSLTSAVRPHPDVGKLKYGITQLY